MKGHRQLAVAAMVHGASMYAAKVFQAIGMDVKHEAVGEDGGAGYGFCLLRKGLYPEGLSEDAMIVQQTRHPVSVVNSLRHYAPAYWEAFHKYNIDNGLDWRPMEEPLTKRSMKLWIWLNELAEGIAEFTYRVEDMERALPVILDMLGLPNAAFPDISRKTNTHRKSSDSSLSEPPPLTWDDLYVADSELFEKISQMANRYGYTDVPIPRSRVTSAPENAVVQFSLGIGDLVFGEPGIRLSLNQGVKIVHLFARCDGLRLYHAYPGVKTYPLVAKSEFTELTSRYPLVSIDNKTHAFYDQTNRTAVFTKSIVTSLGLQAPGGYEAPMLPISDENVEWAETYTNKREGEQVIIWQMSASRPYKTLPVDKSLRAIESLSENGYRVLVIADNHNVLPRLQNVKWMRGISIERFMGLCRVADRVVAHDSAPAWIAAAVGAEVMAIFGPTNPSQYAILADNVKVLRWTPLDRCYHCFSGCSEQECLKTLPDDVLYSAASEGFLPAQVCVEPSDWQDYTTAAVLLTARLPAEGLAATMESLLRQTYQQFELVVGEITGSGLYESVIASCMDDRVKVIRMPEGTTPEQGQKALTNYAAFAGFLHKFTVESGEVWEQDVLSEKIYSRLRGDWD